MDTLGEDLVLLSIRDNGRVATKERIGFGLMGSELVRLALASRVDIQDGRIVVLDPTPTGDPELDQALASITAKRRPPKAKDWVGAPRRKILDAYLDRLASSGVLQRETGGFLPITRWRVADPARVTAARAQLDAIAQGRGQGDTAEVALAGLATAAGLGTLLYPGWSHRAERKRLEQVGAGTSPTPQGHRAEVGFDRTGVADAGIDGTGADGTGADGTGADGAALATGSAAAQAAADHARAAQHGGEAAAHAAGHAASQAAAAGQAAAHAASQAAAHAASQAAAQAAAHAAAQAAAHAAAQAAAHAASAAAAHSAGHGGGGAVGGHGH